MSTWEDFITHILLTTTKVEKLAVYDGRGRPVATTDNMETSESEGFALLKCSTDASKTMTKISVDNSYYICVQGICNTFIGTCYGNSSRVIVARLDGDHLIVLIGNAEDRGSFISELTRALNLKAQGKLMTQRQLQQSQELIPVDINAGATPMISSEQVLVDING